jgi:ribosomal protein S18 acetylase RimI-like enzyme
MNSETTKTKCTVRRMEAADLKAVANVHGQAFPRQLHSDSWIECNFKAFPKVQIFVAEANEEIVGMIYWTEKSGFRQEAVVDLEQLAVLPQRQGSGIGTQLIIRSLPMVAKQIAKRGARLRHLLVNTRTDNSARRIYEKTMGVKEVAIISGLFSADEVFLAAINVTVDPEAEFFSLVKESTV